MKLKKFLSYIGSLSIASLPIAASISCGDNNIKIKDVKSKDRVMLFVQGGPQMGNHLSFNPFVLQEKGSGFQYTGELSKFIINSDVFNFIPQTNWKLFKDIRLEEAKYYNNIFSQNPIPKSELIDPSNIKSADILKWKKSIDDYFINGNTYKNDLEKNILNIKNQVNFYKDQGKKVILVGQSFGGFLLTNILSEHPEYLINADNIIISASRYNLNSYIDNEINSLKSFKVDEKNSDESVFSQLLDTYAQTKFLQGLKTDITSNTLSNSLKEKTLFIYNNSDKNTDEGVGKLTSKEKEWVDKYNHIDATKFIEDKIKNEKIKGWTYPYTHAYLFNNLNLHNKILDYLKN